MAKKKSSVERIDDWLGEAMTPVIGKALSSFRYHRASGKRGAKKIDKLVLRFPNGNLTIAPDPVGSDIELVVYFTPKRI